MKPPDLFGVNENSDDEYIDDEARRKQQQRANKTRKESVAAPDIFGDRQGSSEEDDEDDDQKEIGKGTKRRGSQVYMNDEALAKREARKNHRRLSSVATPPIFTENYDPEKVTFLSAKSHLL